MSANEDQDPATIRKRRAQADKVSAAYENGVLTVMCGGEADTYARAEPVIMAYARACRLLGPAGARVGFLTFNFHNGAMSTRQCQRR